MLGKLIRGGDKKKFSLKLTVVRGFNLVAKSNGTSDPLCEISFGKHKWTTKVEKDTVNPTWNETFEIGFFDEKDSLDIRCFNKEASSKEAMGSISISLKDYAKPGSFQKSYPLTAKEKGSASGFLDFEFVVQGDSSAQVFRCPLEVVIAIQRSKYPDLIIPVFVRRSLEILRKNGMSEEGLFRKSGSTGDINWAIETLDKDFDADIFTRIKDVHTVANLVKRFIRDIPGSLMPHEVEEPVRQAMDQSDPLPALKAVLKNLPLIHRELLREVTIFAADITKNAATKMNSNTMAIVLGPNLWPAGQGGVLNESKLIMEFAEYIISHCDTVFPDTEKATAKEVAEALARIEKEVSSKAERLESPKPEKDRRDRDDRKDKERSRDKKEGDKKEGDKKDRKDGDKKRDDRRDDKKDDKKRDEDRKRDEDKRRDEDKKRAEEKRAEEEKAQKARDAKRQAEEEERKKTEAASAAAAKKEEEKPKVKLGDVTSTVKHTPQHELERREEEDDLPGERNDITEGDADDAGVRIYRVRGEWAGRTAGGCLTFSSWRHNQQVFMSAQESKVAKIKLVQDGTDLHHIGFYVAKAKDLSERRQLLLTDEDIVHKEGFKAVREMYAEVPLQGGQMYVVIPCTFSPLEEAPYRLFVQTQGKLSARLSPKDTDMVTTDIDGEWAGRTAGGCRNHPTCAFNPQYLLKSFEKTVVTVILSQNDTEDFDTIGFYIFKTKDPKRRLTKFPAPDILAKTEFATPKEAAAVVTLPENGTFVIVPCTFEPGKEANYRLSLLSTRPLRVSELKDETREVALMGEWRIENSGGAPEFPSWRLNPQFFLMMFNSVKVSLTLRQRDKKLVPIGFWIVRAPAADRVHVIRDADVVAKVDPKETQSVSLEIELEKSDLPYVIVAFTAQPGQVARFQLTAANKEENARSKGFACIGINSTWPKRSFHGEWRSGLNGGDKSGDSWLSNPQYFFQLSQPARVVAIISSAVKGNFGVYIVKATENAPLKAASDVLLETKLVGVEAAGERELPAGAYMAVAFAEKGRDGAFDLSLCVSNCVMEADAAGFDLVRLSKEKSKTALDKVFTTPFTDVQLGERIGQGQLGVVYKGTLLGKQEVAVKRYTLLDGNDREYFKKEVGILRRAKHASVAVFCGASLYEDEALIIYDYYAGQSLHRTLQQRKDLSWDQKLKIALDAAKGVIYLHNHKRVHRHLTSHNILIDKDLSAKVTDFAFPRRITTALASSLPWSAPEILMQFSNFTDRSDTYAFGMILWELLSHEAPFAGFTPYQVVRALDEREMPDLPSGTIKPYRRLLKACWDRHPHNRPSIPLVLEQLESFVKDGKAITIVDKSAAESD